jgi:actin-related protein 10
MASNILVVGGTACAPKFIPRIRDSLATLLEPTNPTFQPNDMTVSAWKARSHEPYRELYGLKSSMAILNDPRPAEARGGSKGGTAPRWAPSLMSWIGGSLAG